MLNTILDAIYQSYLEEDFNEQFGITSSHDFGNSSKEYFNYLRDSDEEITVKIKKDDTVSEETFTMEDIMGVAIAHGEEVGFKNGFLVGFLLSNRINSKPINFNCKN